MAKISNVHRALCGMWAAGVLALPSVASADSVVSEGCKTLVGNTVWTDGLTALKQAVDAKEYEAGLKAAAPLAGICPESPILNYYVGMVMKGSGDSVKSLLYFQKASQYMSDFAVPPETSRRIWYARYEGEYPERTEDSVNRRTEENKRLIADNTALREKLALAERSVENLTSNQNRFGAHLLAEARSRYATTMWTGIGVGIAGVLVGVGGGLVAGFVNNNENGKITPEYNIGWGMIGGGVALTIAGAIVAGIGGWQYTHAELEDIDFHDTQSTVSEETEETTETEMPAETAQDVSVSFNFTGTGAFFGMTF